MSHIPSNAMPHAGHIETPEEKEETANAGTLTERAGDLAEKVNDRASGLAEKVRANPKPAIAAGAALLAGAVAAAAIPLIGRNWSKDESKNSGGAKTSAKKSAAGKAGAAKTNAKAKSRPSTRTKAATKA